MNLVQSSTLDRAPFSLLNMGTMAERLAHALKVRGMDAPDLIASTGLSKGTIYNILNGDTKAEKVRDSTTAKICRPLGIRSDWLTRGDGPMDAGAAEVRVAEPATAPGYVRIPRLAVEASAGGGAIVEHESEVVEMLEVADWWAQQNLPRDLSKVRVVTARGDSMAPDIQHGDVLFVDVSQPRFEAPGLYVMNWNGRALVKRLVPEIARRRLAIMSNNPAYPPEHVSAEEVDSLHIAGRVAAWWTLRKF